jgi:hypothetical protein
MPRKGAVFQLVDVIFTEADYGPIEVDDSAIKLPLSCFVVTKATEWFR